MLTSFRFAALLITIANVFAVAQSSQSNSPVAGNVAVPLAFEKNLGQAPLEDRYIVRTPSLRLQMQKSGFTVSTGRGPTASSVSIDLANANLASKVIAAEPGGFSNYLIGNSPSDWITGVQQFGRITYSQIYPGIDLTFYGNVEHLEHDFVLQAGVDPRQIQLVIGGARSLSITPEGDLDIHVRYGSIKLRRPDVYQLVGSDRVVRAGTFTLLGNNRAGFHIGSYDHTKTLVIDPVLSFVTYLDGSTGQDLINAVTVDATGNIYVTGATNSTDFPTKNAFQPACNNCSDGFADYDDAFVTEMNSSGTALIFSTFFGGSNFDYANAIVVDKSGNIIISGETASTDFPTAGSLPNQVLEGNNSGHFVTSLKPGGEALNFSGVLGQTGVFDTNNVLAADSSGNVYLSGQTDSKTFPVTIGPKAVGYPYDSTFILKLQQTGTLTYSVLIPSEAPNNSGSNNNEFMPGQIAVDSSQNVLLAGTASDGLPTTSGVVGATFYNPNDYTNGTNGFLLKTDPTGEQILFSTYLPSTDSATSFAVDSSGDIYVAGQTEYSNLAVSSNAFQKTLTDEEGGYVLKLNSSAASIEGGTYFSGLQGTEGTEFTGPVQIALDKSGNIAFIGSTSDPSIPFKNPIQTTFYDTDSESTGFIAQLDGQLSTLLFGSFFSGLNVTPVYAEGVTMTGLVLDSSGAPIIVGNTYADDLPTTKGAFQTAPPSPSNSNENYPRSFIAKIDIATAAPSACFTPSTLNFGTISINSSTSLPVTITNCGNASLTVKTVTSSAPQFTTTNNCSAIAAGDTCQIQVSFSPAADTTYSTTISFVDNAAVPRQSFTASGGGGSPSVSIPSSANLGEAVVNTTSSPYYLYFENTGNANYIVSSVSVTGNFAVTNNCASPVAPNGSCYLQLTFTPASAGTDSGTLTISDNLAGRPHKVALTGTGLSSYPVPTLLSVGAVPQDANPATVFLTGTNFFPQTTYQWNGVARSFEDDGPNEAEGSLLAADLAQVGDVPVKVQNPAPGGGASAVQFGNVYGALRNIMFEHAVYAAQQGLVYATVASSSTIDPGTLVAIDPTDSKVVSVFALGGGPNNLAVSDDGALLYVGLDTSGEVVQIALPGGDITARVFLGSSLVAHAIRVLPGLSHSWVVNTFSSQDSPGGVALYVYDDAAARPNSYSAFSLDLGYMTFVNGPSKLYALQDDIFPPTLYRFAIDSSGISLDTTASEGASSPLDSDGINIYTASGEVIDPATLATTSTIALKLNPTALHVDATDKLIYYYGSSNFEAVSLTSLTESGLLSLPEYGSFTSLLRWGSNGLWVGGGFGNSDGLSVETSITGTSATVSAAKPTAVSVSSSLAKVSPSQSFTLTAKVSVVGASGSPTGTVTFRYGSEVLGTSSLNGSATASLTIALPSSFLGNYGITAGYSGSSAYAPSVGGPASVEVMSPPSVTLAVTPSPVPAGSAATLMATVIPAQGYGTTPTGKVEFLYGSTVLATAPVDSTGVASFSTFSAGLPVGAYSLTARYGGDSNYPAVTSSPLKVLITLDPTTTSLSASSTSVSEGAAVTLTATVTDTIGEGSISGTVTFYADSIKLASAAVNSGVAKFTASTSGVNPDSYTVTADYGGSGTAASSKSNSVTITVTK